MLFLPTTSQKGQEKKEKKTGTPRNGVIYLTEGGGGENLIFTPSRSGKVSFSRQSYRGKGKKKGEEIIWEEFPSYQTEAKGKGKRKGRIYDHFAAGKKEVTQWTKLGEAGEKK